MMKFLISLNIKVFYYDPYLKERFSATKLNSLDGLVKKTDIIFLSYVDQKFNPIVQVNHHKKIWDLWYHFSNSKLNRIFYKKSDFREFSILNSDSSKKIVKFANFK